MAKSKNKGTLRWVGFAVGSTLLLFPAGGIIAMMESTMVNPWIFFGVVVALGVASGAVLHRLWGKLTGSGKFYLNFPLHVVVFTILVSATLLMVNYFATDFDRLPARRVIVENRLAKTRYHTKRVTRRTYTRGAPYKVYYLEISLPDGKRKEVYVKKSLYDKARKGDTATVNIGPGALSFPILDPHSLKLLHPHVDKKRASRCKFFGTSGGYKPQYPQKKHDP